MDNERLHEALSLFMRRKDKCKYDLLDKLGASNLSAKQFSYLAIINENPRVTTTRLAEILGITKPSVTEIVNKLQKEGCVYKKRCLHDGRVFYLELTEKGKNTSRVNSLAYDDFAKEILESLDTTEVDHFITLLTKITKKNA